MFFAEAEKSFWNGASGSTDLYVKLIVALLAGFAVLALLLRLPPRGRRAVVVGVTFLSGLFYIAFYLWPKPLPGVDGTGAPLDPAKPRDFVEYVGFYLKDALPMVADFSNILSTFLLGLGVFSIIRIHGRKLVRKQTDWGFSLVLMIAVVVMVVVGYFNYWFTHYGPNPSRLELPKNWGFFQYANDLLFNGLLQQMDAAMFSLIAFYILSAAYRAFRIRSVEATILLATALIVIFSLMGVVAYEWDAGVNRISGAQTGGFAGNFTLTEIYTWIKQSVQDPSIRAIDFGVGIGTVAMGLRLWLSLERGGASA